MTQADARAYSLSSSGEKATLIFNPDLGREWLRLTALTLFLDSLSDDELLSAALCTRALQVKIEAEVLNE